MSFLAKSITLGTSFILSGCVVVVPFNQSAAELRASKEKHVGKYTFAMPLEAFLANAHLAQTRCSQSLSFIVAPDKASATAMLQVPGLTSTAALAIVDAKAVGSTTEVEFWAQNTGWQSNYESLIKQIENPEKCR